MVEKTANIIHRVTYYACVVGMIVLLIMMFMTAVDVIGRGLFNLPIKGNFELTGYLFAVIILLGFGYAQQSGKMVRVEIVTNRLPPRSQAILDAVITFMILCFCALIIWQGFSESLNAFSVKSSSDIWHIPSYPFQFLVALGAFLLFLELMIKFIKLIKSIRTGVFTKDNVKKEITGLD